MTCGIHTPDCGFVQGEGTLGKDDKIEKEKRQESLASSLDAELVIDEANFDSYFHDVRMNKPRRGQIMARYAATAEFCDGRLKRDVVGLILNKDKAVAATNVMRKLGCATQKDSIRICREIAADLVSGMTEEEVCEKVYKFGFEAFYYTKKEFVPVDDPHWSVISLKNLDEFLDGAQNKYKISSKIIDGNSNDQA